MAGWNFADVWETVAETIPEAPALAHGERTTTWAEFDARADGVARALLASGVSEGTSVAQYLLNGPAYLEATFAAFKLGLAPVNTNYRYVDDELRYLWDNADSSAVVFHGQFTERVEGLRHGLPAITCWLWVDDGTNTCPDWAVDFDAAASSSGARAVAPWGRSGDSLYLLYTGGTTGMPKGVMWRNDDLVLVLNEGAPKKRAFPATADLDHVRSVVASPGYVTLPACPLMHGTGAFNAFTALSVGGSVVTLAGSRFDPIELLDAVQNRRVNNTAIVGDAFARPLLTALDEHPGRWDLSSLRVVLSSGVMWSRETKQGLLRHNPGMMLVDTLGSSEAVGMASSVSKGDGAVETATFTLGPNTRVIADDGTEVLPGSETIGKIAIKGRTPVGYYKDPAKSAETFITIDGARFSMPGDYASVAADGTLTLLGRGSVCINTGGEKVFPEEVEEALKTHPSIQDAVVVGVPHERFGQAIVGVVETRAGFDTPDESELIGHVKERLAAYKAPKRVLTATTLGRAANGKIDYKRWTAHASDHPGG